jgi:hypothetical protein
LKIIFLGVGVEAKEDGQMRELAAAAGKNA